MDTYIPIADKKYYIGIDNGIQGAIVVIDQDQNIIEKHIMPVVGKTRKEYDIFKIVEILRHFVGREVLAILEKAQPHFRDGSKQSFKTGFGYAVMQTTLITLRIPFEIVGPKIWQKEVFKGLDTKDTKVASILYCQRKYPKEDWRATERCTKMHDGLTDGTCMALYGLKYLNR